MSAADQRQSWPALAGRWPGGLACSRAVWGKAHGAISDFRWLAASPDLEAGRLDLGRRLNLGLEDRPAEFVAWRRLESLGIAVGGYPSRAADAAGRRGFLEKGVLVTRLADDVPAAVAALLLLPSAALLDDRVWWPRREDPAWREGSFVLPLEPGPELPVTPVAVAAAVAAGQEELRSVLTEAGLAAFYASLLAGARPAILGPLAAPLAPEALAALLLPLPRETADRLSLAGWLPVSRCDPRELASRWNVVALPAGLAMPSVDALPDADSLAAGARLAAALLHGAPELLAEPESRAVSVAANDPHALPAAETSWEAWTAAMYSDLARTTNRLVALGLWEAWRRQAVLGPVERSRTALAWLASGAWSLPDVEPPSIEAWEAALEDTGAIGDERMKSLCAGAQGRHTWPWIPGHEERQLRVLLRRTKGAEAAEHLRHSLGPERAPLFERLVEELSPRDSQGPSPETATADGARVLLFDSRAVGARRRRRLTWLLLSVAVLVAVLALVSRELVHWFGGAEKHEQTHPDDTVNPEAVE